MLKEKSTDPDGLRTRLSKTMNNELIDLCHYVITGWPHFPCFPESVATLDNYGTQNAEEEHLTQLEYHLTITLQRY